MNWLAQLLLIFAVLGFLPGGVESRFEFGAQMDPYDNGLSQCHNKSALFNVTSALFNAGRPPSLKISNIWCVAKTKKNDLRKISGGVYWKMNTKEQIGGVIEKHGQTLRLTLEIQNANFSHLGEYRCDLYVDSKIKHYYASEFLQINMRPVFVFNSTSGYKLADKDRFTVIAPKTWAKKDETVMLNCPTVSFPALNETVWYKEDESGVRKEICSSSNSKILHNRITLYPNGTLVIINLTSEDSGKYYCVVNNSISTPNGVKVFDATLVHELTVKGHYLWVIPLIIIGIMAVLLFIIIYGCGIIKRCRSYNVEKRERRHVKTSETHATSGDSRAKEPILNYNKNEIEQ